MPIDPSNKSFCTYIWNSICIRHNGRLQPCCMYDDTEPAPHIHDFNNDVEATYTSDFYVTMRENALKGIPNKGCELCYFREKETGLSLRSRANYNDWTKDFTNQESNLDNVSYLEIFVGNRCNLKCLMCDPKLSSSLASDYEKLGLIDEKDSKPYEIDYQDLVSQLDNLQRIKFVGGEPLMNKKHWELLRSIPKEKAKSIVLEYATNCTFFPDSEKLNLWSNFSALEIILSIDGFDSVNSYIRYPSQWKTIERNSIKFQQLTNSNPQSVLGINAVVSNFNIFNLDELTTWISQHLGPIAYPSGRSSYNLTCLTYPDYLNIKHLPQTLKAELLEKYSDDTQYSYVQSFLKSTGQVEKIEPLKENVKKFDELRNITYKDYIPALKVLL